MQRSDATVAPPCEVWQSRQVTVSRSVHSVPGSQAVHSLAPRSGAKVPRLHFSHLCMPSFLANVPGRHNLHCLEAELAEDHAMSQLPRLTTVNMDFIRHYRPMTNVVNRPTLQGGRGINLVGHHEIMLPLLAAAIYERAEE